MPDALPAADERPALETQPHGGMSKRAKRSALLGAIAAVALLAVGAYVLLGGRGGGGVPDASAAATAAPKFGPAQVDVATVVAKSEELGRPIYWAGAPKGAKLELTIAADDGNTLRYLRTDGRTDAASTRAVAMYPMADAYTAAQQAAAREGAMSQSSDNVLVVGNTANAYNGYLAAKNLPYLVEVFDPTPGKAWKLLTTGKIVPVTKADAQ